MTTRFQPVDAARFAAALRRFDEENARDPNQIQAAGTTVARELVYAQWLSAWVEHLAPNASEELRLAARCQHLCRWLIPRSAYPMTRAGYLRWREDLKKLHAQKAGEILREVGYPGPVIERVQALQLKARFPHDPEGRILEDALCLVFLEHQFAPLADKTSEAKMINALKKAWGKMTGPAQELAKQFPFTDREQRLLNQALGLPTPQQHRSTGTK